MLPSPSEPVIRRLEEGSKVRRDVQATPRSEGLREPRPSRPRGWRAPLGRYAPDAERRRTSRGACGTRSRRGSPSAPPPMWSCPTSRGPPWRVQGDCDRRLPLEHRSRSGTREESTTLGPIPTGVQHDRQRRVGRPRETHSDGASPPVIGTRGRSPKSAAPGPGPIVDKTPRGPAPTPPPRATDGLRT